MEYSFKKPETLLSVHDACKAQTVLCRETIDGQDLGKALFYAIKKQDWKHAFYLLELGAPVCKLYESEKGVYLSTISLLIKSMCGARKFKGHQVLDYKIPDRILDAFIQLKVDLQCRCTPKFAHRCPLYVALNELEIKSEQEIFLPKNVLIRKLIMNGATLKKHWRDPRNYNIPWFDLEQIRSYLNTYGIKAQTQALRRPMSANIKAKQEF